MLISKQWHKFPQEYHDFYRRFKAGGTLRDWCNEMNKLVTSLPFKDANDQNKFKGDMFEIFAELFFKIQPINSFFGLVDYTPCKSELDFGVDGVGVNSKDFKTIVQVKYRSNPSDEIPYSELAKTYADGIMNYDFPTKNDSTLFLFTNASRASWQAEKFFGKMLVVIHKKHIEKAIDNNKPFWHRCFDFIDRTMGHLIKP